MRGQGLLGLPIYFGGNAVSGRKLSASKALPRRQCAHVLLLSLLEAGFPVVMTAPQFARQIKGRPKTTTEHWDGCGGFRFERSPGIKECGASGLTSTPVYAPPPPSPSHP